MSRLSNQKLKPLYLARILLEHTDADNLMTADELVTALGAYGIPARRRSLYDDIEALRQFGYDITLRPGKGGGYFIAARDFELPELKLLVDAVQSSRLITDKKSGELIEKLSKLASAAQAKQLNRQVYISGRAKSMNEHVFYNIDAIHAAINDGKKIGFKYFEYDIKKKRVFRKNGGSYIRTPVALCWNDDNYYLVTYNPKYDDPFANYRVDRMTEVAALEEAADKWDKKAFKITDYVKRSFGMYSGVVEQARLAFDASLVSAVLDHFGSQTRLHDLGDGRFEISAPVSSSSVFFGWMFQFGEKAEILEPESMRAAMREHIATAGKLYSAGSH
jgi:predicted DNA-binding transcriptional regulator YafY